MRVAVEILLVFLMAWIIKCLDEKITLKHFVALVIFDFPAAIIIFVIAFGALAAVHSLLEWVFNPN
jgi:hypothetical protein